ncbi:MAG: radical SAM protein, partial [Fibrobacterota bacterium]
MMYKYLFGPIPSRRLGISLGVDMVPHKVCTINCVYCECGETNCSTTTRQEYVPADTVIKELRQFMQSSPELDCITFSGAGEPTLNSEIGRVITWVKEHIPAVKLVMLTNGTLLDDPQVRAEIMPLDIAKISVDAVSFSVFQKINRPDPHLDLERIKEGIITFSRAFPNSIWLEYFLVPGVNDSEEELHKTGEYLRRIRADKLQINTLDRPAPEDWVEKADAGALGRAMKILGAHVSYPVLNISKVALDKRFRAAGKSLTDIVLNQVSRRPMTRQDLTATTGRSSKDLQDALDTLLTAGRLQQRRESRGIFYE